MSRNSALVGPAGTSLGESGRKSSIDTETAGAEESSGGLILVVEDKPAVAWATEMLLKAADYQVLRAATAEEAEDVLRRSSRIPDLIMCDFHLGRPETGITAIEALRTASNHRFPAILVTGDTSLSIAEMVKDVDDCYLLRKPVDSDRLLALIDYLI